MRYEYLICHPNSGTVFTTAKTMKEAKLICNGIKRNESFLYQWFGEPMHIPCIKRRPILKGNKHEQNQNA
jgi:hypothetical protein